MAQMLFASWPNARFLAITAHQAGEDIYRALDAGAGSYLLKGMAHGVLIDALRRVSAGEHFLPLLVDRDHDTRASRI
jgi:DNA-binding NarL/FixJ family response regulator